MVLKRQHTRQRPQEYPNTDRRLNPDLRREISIDTLYLCQPTLEEKQHATGIATSLNRIYTGRGITCQAGSRAGIMGIRS